MPMYEVKCSDGSDPNCVEFFDVEIDLEGLSEEQIDDICNRKELCLTVEQAEEYRENLDLSDEDLENARENDELCINFTMPTVCAFCGSDQT